MPRVNRDLQRRLAARRERERRRPTERRYRFASPVPADELDAPANGLGDQTPADTGSTRILERPSRSDRADAPGSSRTTVLRPPTRSFSDYATEYAYVTRDLRRVALVIGSLLVVLIVLYFVLPH
ncbi:MAG: hypothetical protein JOY61_15295 [Chloroflexi bacterium]|nr:hypothetical protein [Chloroflexota bacterium]